MRNLNGIDFPTLDVSFLNECNDAMQPRSAQAYLDAGMMMMRMHIGNSEVPAILQKRIDTPEKARIYLEGCVAMMLRKGEYRECATLLLGYSLFDPRPYFTQKVFEVLGKYHKVLIPGANGTSKTYSTIVWLLMDYLEDSFYTKIRLVHVNEQKIKSDLFAPMKTLMDNSVLDLGLEYNALTIFKKGDTARDCNIQGLPYPKDENSTGRLKSVKPARRSKDSDKWGNTGKVRILLDEASHMSKGVYADLDSPLSAMNENGTVKIIGLFNCEYPYHWTAKLASPHGGLENINIDRDFEWESSEAWRVLRLDGAQSENVIQRKAIYPGIQSWEYHKSKLNDPDRYIIVGRGWYNLRSNGSAVIPIDFITRNQGEFIFQGHTINVGSADLAFEGGDNAIFTHGRWGEAIGWVTSQGERIMFLDTTGKPKTQWGLQVDGQLAMNNNEESTGLAKEVIAMAKRFAIQPEHLVVDSTGSGTGAFDIVRKTYGNVMGIKWSFASTKVQILAEDTSLPETEYDGIFSEMWYAARTWFEHNIIKISPHIEPTGNLYRHLRNRNNSTRSGRINRRRIETKAEYKARGNPNSPDEADSMIMLPQLVRERIGPIPSLSGTVVGNTVIQDSEMKAPECASEVDNLLMDIAEENKINALHY